MEKTFTRAGVSNNKGKVQFRFTNDLNREKVLDKNGHTDIDLVDLPQEMTKGEIAQYLFETDFAKGRQSVIDAIQDLAKKNKVKLVQPQMTREEVMTTPALVYPIRSRLGHLKEPPGSFF
jgi:hypothetical protein